MVYASPEPGNQNIGGKFARVAPLVGRWLVVLLIAFAGSPYRSAAQGTLYTIMTNGPATNRLNIVIFSEGYTTNDLASRFLSDATNALEDLLAYDPYQEYQSYCNVYAIAVPSKISGSTHLHNNGNIFVRDKTYFNSTYDFTYDYIISIPPYNVDTVPADGMGKVAALLQARLPGVLTNSVLPVMLVNDISGGSGGPICISGTGILEPQLIVHESGHTLAPLGDEYGQGYTDVRLNTNLLANTTTTTNLQSIKWKAWIPPGTPIPTEQSDYRYAGVVGLFQGANYTSSAYRPALRCVMNNPWDESIGPTIFCPVCCEALLEAIYKRARPIDSLNPATNKTISITNTAAVAFSVTPLQPATHNLAVQWYANGTAIPGATSPVYSLAPLSFTNGVYILKAQVNDPTPLVQAADDPTGLLSGSVSWTVNLGVRVLTIDSAQWFSTGAFSFRLTGRAANGFIIQSSTNLVNWVSVSTNNLTSGQFYYTNSGLAGTGAKFYRALLR